MFDFIFWHFRKQNPVFLKNWQFFWYITLRDIAFSYSKTFLNLMTQQCWHSASVFLKSLRTYLISCLFPPFKTFTWTNVLSHLVYLNEWIRREMKNFIFKYRNGRIRFDNFFSPHQIISYFYLRPHSIVQAFPTPRILEKPQTNFIWIIIF